MHSSVSFRTTTEAFTISNGSSLPQSSGQICITAPFAITACCRLQKSSRSAKVDPALSLGYYWQGPTKAFSRIKRKRYVHTALFPMCLLDSIRLILLQLSLLWLPKAFLAHDWPFLLTL